MKKRKLGIIDFEISPLGFGLMRLPRTNPNTQEIDYPLAEKMIDYAIKNGVNYFDTAWPYHDGMSETFVGDVLRKYDRSKIHIASKCPMWEVKSLDDVTRIFNQQLKKCKVDYFDFYLLHALNERSFQKVISLGVFDVLSDLKKAGKIKYLGFSFHDRPSILKKIVDTYQFDFAQIQFNYVDYEEYQSNKQYQILRDRNIPIIIMEPVRGGALATLNENARKVFLDYNPQRSVASWALRYCLSFDGILTVLSGMSNLIQVEDNIKTAIELNKLSKEELNLIETAKKIYRSSDTILCTNCRYCMPCPHGVNIPKNFLIYNEYRIHQDPEKFLSDYHHQLSDTEKSNKCVRCNECVSKCPQSLEIPKLLYKVSETIERITE
ncbi:aldo/keto reductase [Acholeplasma sp. OttesenSCG-928-E16]|nr:aldo/keto reductase [Acholeplasma sp. OttesenSCG-928-E16]